MSQSTLPMATTTKPEGEEDVSIIAEINITPLTDIFLVLLIIFMVTSSVMSQMGVDVDLPKASQGVSAAQPDGVIVSLGSQGSIKVNGQSVGYGQWEEFERLLQLGFVQSTNRTVILEGDQKAFLGSVIEVMDHARKSGAQGFAIATQPE